MRRFLEVLERAHTGPVCEVKEWDSKVIPTKVKEKLREYGLEGTCDPDNPVNEDDGLADKFWQAGFDLVTDVGMLCLDTRRIIKFTEEELKEVIKEAPSEMSMGRGEDRVVIKARKPEDKIVPVAWMGPLGIETSEDLCVPLNLSTVQYRVIDVMMPTTSPTIMGKLIRAGTPYETIAGKEEPVIMREIARRAGRPGMPIEGIVVATTEYGQLGGYGVPNGLQTTEPALILPISELKTSYSLLHKVAHNIINCGGIATGGHWSMIGGYVGGPEGAAVVAAGSILLTRAIHLVFQVAGLAMDIIYRGNSGREALWATSVALQAQNRNTNMMTGGLTSQLFGPCTPELLYETTTTAITHVTSGAASELGTRPTGCKYPNYASGLENKFGAEVTKCAAGMKRDMANEIVKTFLPKYEDRLEHPSKGKSFTECTDLKTLQPTKEWQDIYVKVWKELEDLGLPRP